MKVRWKGGVKEEDERIKYHKLRKKNIRKEEEKEKYKNNKMHNKIEAKQQQQKYNRKKDKEYKKETLKVSKEKHIRGIKVKLKTKRKR